MSSERPEDVDEAFARLVAGFHDAPGAPERTPSEEPPASRVNPWPAAEDLDEVRHDRAPEPETPDDPADDLTPAGPGAGILDTPASWDDEGHFVPPEPPPVPRPAPLRLAAWLGVLVGPVLLMVTAGLGWDLPQPLLATIIVGFVGGVVYLIATMDDSPPDPYDRGDGAVV